jgi:hypothetical protein
MRLTMHSSGNLQLIWISRCLFGLSSGICFIFHNFRQLERSAEVEMKVDAFMQGVCFVFVHDLFSYVSACQMLRQGAGPLQKLSEHESCAFER